MGRRRSSVLPRIARLQGVNHRDPLNLHVRLAGQGDGLCPQDRLENVPPRGLHWGNGKTRVPWAQAEGTGDSAAEVLAWLACELKIAMTTPRFRSGGGSNRTTEKGSIVLITRARVGTVRRKTCRLRVALPDAIYHVMNRGDRREDVFHDDQDRTRSPGRIYPFAQNSLPPTQRVCAPGLNAPASSPRLRPRWVKEPGASPASEQVINTLD